MDQPLSQHLLKQGAIIDMPDKYAFYHWNYQYEALQTDLTANFSLFDMNNVLRMENFKDRKYQYVLSAMS